MRRPWRRSPSDCWYRLWSSLRLDACCGRSRFPSQHLPMREQDRWFTDATEFHRRGQLDHAEKLYRFILERQPQHFGSLHLLGVIHAQRGDHAAALSHIDAALALNRNDANAFNNRGIALKELHRPLE